MYTNTTPRTNVVANAMHDFGDLILWGKVNGYNAYTSDSCGPYAVLVDDPADPGWRTWDELSEQEVSEAHQ